MTKQIAHRFAQLANEWSRSALAALTSILAVAIFWLVATSAHAEEVDLELVLAMDGSGSISEREYILQLEGTARAFEDPAIRSALRSGPIGRIAVSVLIWSDAAFPKFKSGWFILDTDESAALFANKVRNFHKHTGRKFGIGGGGTGIGEGIRVALEMIRTNRFQGLRQVVDVSGDGIETDPWFKKAITLPAARALAQRDGVTLNGLPILTADFPHLDDYYRSDVINGPGAFVVIADGFEDFGRAIREKLWREISHSIAWAPQLNSVITAQKN